MKTKVLRLATLVALCLTASCSGTASPGASASATVGSGGGTVSTSNGTQVKVPAGALGKDTLITIALDPSAPVPTGVTVVGTPYVFGPEGLVFSTAVTVTLSFDPARVPAGRSVKDIEVFTAPVGSNDFTKLSTTVLDKTHVAAETAHFSVFVPAISDSDAGASDAAAKDSGHISDGGEGPDAGADAAESGGGLTGGIAVSGGTGQTCALLSGGVVVCWGDNGYGELGDGTMTSSLTPVVVGLSDAIGVAAGADHSCALLSGGTVECWGADHWGELGNGTTTASATPVPVSGLSGVIAISAGGESDNDDAHTCALLSGGSVECWGDDNYEELGDGNTAGDFGNGTFSISSTPVAVVGLTGATAIAVGGVHTCALLTGGTVDCWGDNFDGQLGDGTTTASATPVAVSGLSGAIAIAANGGHHTCALLTGGTVECWGNNDAGQLGNGTTTNSTTPVAVAGLTGVTAIAAGFEQTCAVLSGGTVDCWGATSGDAGQAPTLDSATPVAVRGLRGVTAIAAGWQQMCAVSGGSVYCWGYNDAGQLGNGTTTSSATPVAVAAIASFPSDGGSGDGGTGTGPSR